MQVLELESVGKLAIKEIEAVKPARGEVLLKTLASGICGSETHAFHGNHALKIPPVIMGHEVCAEVIEAPAETNLKPGERVVVLPQKTCGKCKYCTEGVSNLCEDRIMLGTTNWQGSFADYFTAPKDTVFSLQDDVSSDVATLIEPFAVGVHAVRQSGLVEGETAMVLGSGAIGLLTILAAKVAGASKIFATDLKPINLATAQNIGADYAFNPKDVSVVDEIMKLTDGLGVQKAFLAVDGQVVVDQALHSLARRGTLTSIAMFSEDTTINLQRLKSFEQKIVGSLTYAEEDFITALEIANEQHTNMESLITHKFHLDEADEAFALINNNDPDTIRVLLVP